jgi:hypothetical protein
MEPRFSVLQVTQRELLSALDGEFVDFVDAAELAQVRAGVVAATPDRLSLVALRAGELIKKAMLEQSGGDWRYCLVAAAIETFGTVE